MHRSTRKLSLVGLMATAALLVSLAPAAAADEAWVRVLHASPDAPAVDIYVNDAKVGDPLAGLEFGDISTWVPLPAGTYDFKVCASADASVCPIDAQDIALSAGGMYTIAATNNLASIEAQILVDEPAPVAGSAKVRVVHFSADTPAVDVLTQDGSATVVDKLAYPDATPYLTLAGGSYDLKVCADADNSLCPLDPGALDLANGTSYSVFAIGSLAGETLTAVVAVDATALPDSAMGRSSGSLPLIGAGLLALIGAGLLTARRFAVQTVGRD